MQQRERRDILRKPSQRHGEQVDQIPRPTLLLVQKLQQQSRTGYLVASQRLLGDVGGGQVGKRSSLVLSSTATVYQNAFVLIEQGQTMAKKLFPVLYVALVGETLVRIHCGTLQSGDLMVLGVE